MAQVVEPAYDKPKALGSISSMARKKKKETTRMRRAHVGRPEAPWKMVSMLALKKEQGEEGLSHMVKGQRAQEIGS
jgi:hypothetical protein